MKFYLGTHIPNWLAKVKVPLFISYQQLKKYKTPPRARGRWALDSGGFTELALRGEWTIAPFDYAADVMRYMDQVGGLDWAACQDWVCSPIVTQKTFPTTPHREAVIWHQNFTIESYETLRNLAPGAPWAPILQGWRLSDYMRHVEMYDRAGIDLRKFETVGVGTLVKRDKTAEVKYILQRLKSMGIKTHGFGVKTAGLAQCWDQLQSADSLAWSYAARYLPPMDDECASKHTNCANCLKFALKWREDMLAQCKASKPPQQMDLIWGAGLG